MHSLGRTLQETDGLLVAHCLIEGLTIDGQDLVGLLQLSIADGTTGGEEKKGFAIPLFRYFLRLKKKL